MLKSTSPIRGQFPGLANNWHYLDTAATAQKPQVVLDAMTRAGGVDYATVHRGVYARSANMTVAFEAARTRVARFMGAASSDEIVFVRGATEGINLVAQSWGTANLTAGDRIMLSQLEHHSNIVPWQILRDQVGFTLRYVPITDDGQLDLAQLDQLLTERTKLFCFNHMSNVVGTINPVTDLIAAAHKVGAKVMLDGAQSVPHLPVDVQALDVDFMAFSSHKMCGPTGLGVLYGKRDLLEAMPPFMGGGDMIREVKLSGSKWNSLPYKFEAGTPPIAEVIGLGAAVDYLSSVGMEWIHAHERWLTKYAYDRLSVIEGLRILGPGPEERGGLIAFTLNDLHPHDLSALLDRDGIAIRAGHHCAQPVHDRFGIVASARASFYLYNTTEEVDQLAVALEKSSQFFG